MHDDTLFPLVRVIIGFILTPERTCHPGLVRPLILHHSLLRIQADPITLRPAWDVEIVVKTFLIIVNTYVVEKIIKTSLI